MGGAAGIARGETFFDFVDEVFDDDGVDGVAVEVERVGVEPHVFGDVEELRFGDFRWHAFMRAERHDGVDFVVCPLVDAAAQGEHQHRPIDPGQLGGGPRSGGHGAHSADEDYGKNGKYRRNNHQNAGNLQ